MRRKPEEVVGMWSEALRILDENSLKYYVEELKEELDKEKLRTQEMSAELLEKDTALNEKNAKLREQEAALSKNEADIEKLKKELETLKTQMTNS